MALQVAERLDALQVLVGHADAELLLDLEHELDEGQRVDARRIERRGRVERVGIEGELLAGEILDAAERVHRRRNYRRCRNPYNLRGYVSMSPSLYALGLNHQTAPLAIRERVVFHVERLREALTEIKRSLAREAAILSTCNRTELYVAGEEPAAVAQWLARYHRFEPDGLLPYPYTLPPQRARLPLC